MTTQKLPAGVAVVTGAAGGMGSAVARQLAAAGWRELLLCDISAERLAAVAAPLREQGVGVSLLAGDVAAPNFASDVVAALAGQPVGALVHTAGISPLQGDVERIIAVNLDASARLVDAVREHMAAGSAAVLFASNSSYFPAPAEAVAAFTAPLPPAGAVSLAHLAADEGYAYLLSKLGVRALVKREARNFGARGARLVSISPGAIDTPMTRVIEKPLSDKPAFNTAQRMVENSATGRMGTADELAAVAVFLCSPAASFVTAVDWLVDGGHTAGMGF